MANQPWRPLPQIGRSAPSPPSVATITVASSVHHQADPSRKGKTTQQLERQQVEGNDSDEVCPDGVRSSLHH
ncbi:hypothetical protein ACLOJK_026864 [Asimina triloba]